MKRVAFVLLCSMTVSACKPSIEQRYTDWKLRCLEYGYHEDDPQLEHCIKLQEREYRNVLVPWY